MIMEFKKGRRYFFVIFIFFALLAIKLFVPIRIGSVDFTQIPPFFEIKNRFLQLLAFALVFFFGQALASMAATSIGNKEFKRLASLLHFRCECNAFNQEFAPVAAARPANVGIGLAKALLYLQGLYAAGRYEEAIAVGERALELNMGKADINQYLTRCAVCQYLILACCESRDTGKAAARYKELEECVSHTLNDKEKAKKAHRILVYTRNYITFTVNPKYCATQFADEEYRMSDNTYEKIMLQYLLGRLYRRAGDEANAWSSFHYVAEHHSEFVCRAQAQKELETLPEPALAARP